MSRISQLFERKKDGVLSIFYTAGFPTLADTDAIAGELAYAGVDMIEIGMPYSDPVADGPVIQQSYAAALLNGITVSLLLDQVSKIRQRVGLPIVLMGYLNPVMQFGIEAFCSAAHQSGVDGVIIPDMPLSEFRKDYASFFRASNLAVVFMITPSTSESRIREMDEATDGFLYAVSSHATTGTQDKLSEASHQYLARLHSMNLRNPILVGFGIANREMFEEVCKYGAGAVVGSAFVSMISGSVDRGKDVEEFVKEFRG